MAARCRSSLGELMKPGPRRVRYIRKLFRDPINRELASGGSST